MNKERKKQLLLRYNISEDEISINCGKILNGNKIIVLGNHDPRADTLSWLEGNWKVIDGFYFDTNSIMSRVEGFYDPMFSGFVKEFNGKKFLFSHYALFNNDDWDSKNKMIAPRIEKLESIYKALECDYNIHGHLHSNECSFENSINVSFEQIGFKPVKLKDLLEQVT